MVHKLSTFIILVILFDQLAWSSSNSSDFLKRWEQNPQEVSKEIPQKTGSKSILKFSKKEIREEKFIDQKDEVKLEQCKLAGFENCVDSFEPFEFGRDGYTVQRFIGRVPETNIYRLDSYKNGAARITPWSGNYWPHYQGGIGIRYGDPQFPNSLEFKDNFRYYEKNYSKKPQSIVNLDILSPAEKYDLLTEDKDWTLTYNSWAVGRRFYQLSGKVERWMGICHGWAPAAIVIPEPTKSFRVNLPRLGKSVQFYPDDIKALVSQQWASARVPSVMIGGRCNVKNPQTDSNGRIISSECFDTNPASWHLILVNLLGKSSESFVFDATYDFEVWNQPVSSYSLNYFNPSTKELSASLRDAVIPYSYFNNDLFRRYRSPLTKNIVGVELKLTYVVESRPQQNSGVTYSRPLEREVTYYYDLELDDRSNIIGGEWYQKGHPDMMWKPIVKRPVVYGEPSYGIWNGFMPVPLDISSFAKTSAKTNQPINAILEQLISLSHGR